MSAVELKPGIPFCHIDELNRISRQQGLCLAIAQASIFDEICQAVALEAEVEYALTHQYLTRQGIDNDDDLQRYLDQKGWSQEDLLYFATKGERLDRFKRQTFKQEVEIHFIERKLDYDQAHYSLIRVKDENLAFELHQRLLEEEASFEELAAAYSEGPEKNTAGKIGPVPLSQAHEAVVEKLRTSKPGQLLEPFFLVNIWLILRLDTFIGARLEDAQCEEILAELFNKWLNERVGQLLAGETPSQLPTHLLSESL